MGHAPQFPVPALYYRGGTSKGVFFRLEDLPKPARAVPSTILNLRVSPPCIERVGAISPDRLEAALDAGRLETRDPR